MAANNGRVNLTRDELQALHDESAALLEALREEVDALRNERDQALSGVAFLTQALRRRGCCNGHGHDTPS